MPNKYRVKVGTHSDNKGKLFNKGDIVVSNTDLTKVFAGKFDNLGPVDDVLPPVNKLVEPEREFEEQEPEPEPESEFESEPEEEIRKKPVHKVSTHKKAKHKSAWD
jgi:hypothetical protein